MERGSSRRPLSDTDDDVEWDDDDDEVTCMSWSRLQGPEAAELEDATATCCGQADLTETHLRAWGGGHN